MDWEYILLNVFVIEIGEFVFVLVWVKEFDGVCVGFVGVVIEDFDLFVFFEGIKDFEVCSIVDFVNVVVDDLCDGDVFNGEVDVVILFVYEGVESMVFFVIIFDFLLGEIVYGVDDDVDVIVLVYIYFVYNYVIDGCLVVFVG